MNHFISEITVAVLLIILSCLLWNPYWMPMGFMLLTLVCFILLFGGFAVFVWREKGGDERDRLIRQVASRSAHLASALILAIGIAYEILTVHSVDKWLIIAFVVSILAKVGGYIYAKMKY